MSQDYSFARDVDEALAMAQALDEYVRGDTLYGYTAGGQFSTLPNVTGGMLLLRIRRLHVLRDELIDAQVKKLNQAIELYEQVRGEWTFHYETKIKREAHSRLDAMTPFFFECTDNFRDCIGIYKPELLRRTIVQELLLELIDMKATETELEEKAADTDAKLRKLVKPAPFQWAEILQKAYPEEEFWWLYHSPAELG